MVFANKTLSYTFSFRTTNLLLLFQMFFTIILLRLLQLSGFITLDPFTITRARTVAPISFFYSLNAAVALVALREMSVPSYTVVKRLGPLFTLGVEAVLLNKRATRGVLLALLFMSGGTLLAAKSDTSSSAMAWLLGFLSCIFQALYLGLVKRTGLMTGMSSFSILYYHSIMAIPCLLTLVLAVGEIGPAMEYDQWREPGFLGVLILSLFMGVMLNYALFLCTELTSPTSTSVAAQVKAMGQTVAGMFFFGGVDMNLRYLLGTVVNISGGFLYVGAKLQSIQSDSG